MLYSGGYSPDERAQFTWIIHRNVIDGVQAILQGAQDMGHEVAEENEDLAERTLLYEGDNLNADLAADVAALWADPAVKRTFDERDAVQKQTMLHINDSAGYFLDDAARFAQPSYVPRRVRAPAPARRHRARRATAAPVAAAATAASAPLSAPPVVIPAAVQVAAYLNRMGLEVTPMGLEVAAAAAALLLGAVCVAWGTVLPPRSVVIYAHGGRASQAPKSELRCERRRRRRRHRCLRGRRRTQRRRRRPPAVTSPRFLRPR